MKYRTLGNTGLEVSILSYGASPLGGVFRTVEESECLRTVRTALDLGINYIDVAPYYGLTVAETMLGKALKGVPRDSYYLSTKVGRYGQDDFDFSSSRVTASVDESLARIGVDYLDVIQCHDIEFGSPDQIVDEALPALERVRKQGKARFIGITGLPLSLLTEVSERSQVDTILSYCHFCLNDSALVDTLPFLKERGIGIINASPLSMGLLTNRGVPDWHPADLEIRLCCSRAAAHCRSHGVDIAKLALQFAVSNEDIATTLVGTANPDHLKHNVEWIAEDINEDLLAEVLGILEPIHNKTWSSGRRSYD